MSRQPNVRSQIGVGHDQKVNHPLFKEHTMNANRRKELNNVSAKAQDLVSDIEAIEGDVESARDDEQEYLDVMPESMQNGDKGERAQEAIDALESALEDLNEARDAVQRVIDSIDNAVSV